MSTEQRQPPREWSNETYEAWSPPWEIGRPQPAFVELADSGRVKGSVLEVGCGTAEQALLFAERGHEAWGVDIVPKAIELAQQKAAARGLTATFRVGDALKLSDLERTFDAVLDSGVLHVFSGGDRARYAQSVRSALKPGGVYYGLFFSDAEKGPTGPWRIGEADVRATFGNGWNILELRPARFATLRHIGSGAGAWFTAIQREG